MANSIEGRFPFLDVELDEFANGLTPEHKLRSDDLNEKILLKETYGEHLPREILERPKQPYQSPNGKSFFSGNHPGLSWVDEVTHREMVEGAGLFNFIAISKLLEKARKPGQELSYGDNTRIVFILSTMLLYKNFILNRDFNRKNTWESEEFVADFL